MAGGYPSSFFLQKSHLGKSAKPIPILGQPQAEIPKKSSHEMTKTITWVPPLTALWRLQVTLVYTQFQNDMLTVGLNKSLQTTSTYKSNGNSSSLFFLHALRTIKTLLKDWSQQKTSQRIWIVKHSFVFQVLRTKTYTPGKLTSGTQSNGGG